MVITIPGARKQKAKLGILDLKWVGWCISEWVSTGWLRVGL